MVLIGGTQYAGEVEEIDLQHHEFSAAPIAMYSPCTVPRMSEKITLRRCSSASLAQGRPRCQPIPHRRLIGDDEHGWSADRRLQL